MFPRKEDHDSDEEINGENNHPKNKHGSVRAKALDGQIFNLVSYKELVKKAYHIHKVYFQVNQKIKPHYIYHYGSAEHINEPPESHLSFFNGTPVVKKYTPPSTDNARRELLTLILKAMEATSSSDKSRAFKKFLFECKEDKHTTMSKEEIKIVFKNLLWVALQRRHHHFLFHPFNTTASGEAVRDMLNTAEYSNLRTILNIPTTDNTRGIRYRDLRKYVGAENGHSNQLFHSKHYNPKKYFDEDYHPFVECNEERISTRSSIEL